MAEKTAYEKLMIAVKEYVDHLCTLEHAYISMTERTNFYAHIREVHKWDDKELVGMMLEHDAAFAAEMHEAEHEDENYNEDNEEERPDHKHE